MLDAETLDAYTELQPGIEPDDNEEMDFDEKVLHAM
jgi:hypothetical protein